MQAARLAMQVPTIASNLTNAHVLEVFTKYRDLISLPVLEGETPIGLISRNIFMSQMSKPYYRELYEKKTCIAFMDKAPLIVDSKISVEKLAELAVESGDKTLADGFLIVDDARFAGLGSGLDLMRKMVELQTEKNHQVMQSIDYASTIQQAMLSTSDTAMKAMLPDACLTWQPRDIVGGDFYHFESFEHGWFGALADCTGHGVPGAFLTVIASSALQQALHQFGPADPARLMAEVNRKIKARLGQSARGRLSESDDGMDATFFWFDKTTRNLTSASARMPLHYFLPGTAEVVSIPGERMGIGYVDTDEHTVWRNTITQLPTNSILFGATDGLTDQIGGTKNIAFGKQRLRNHLLQHKQLSMEKLVASLLHELHDYQGQHQRRDDLTCFGFRL
ncbi:SpoIIE family protein phosphatase [uncultured Oxalicibacterium sp.]|uniref:SpoIIE family protein phosphatase n=1 Tax=uncultured Oxalicibacterium sp. TaxID=1168540 RepID=UPI0025F6926C|nr:SpoIIE family protein phosphatase [uncultured Oxalicibacterium sp.]